MSTALSPVSCGSGGPSLPRPLPLPAAALGWSLGGRLLNPPIPGSPRETLGGVRKAAVCQGPPGSRSNGRLAHITTVCGICAWGQGRDSTWDWERLVCGAGWRLGGPFLFLEGWWGTQVSRASWACRPGPVRAQIAGCVKRREAGRKGSGGVRSQLHVPAARPGQALPVPPARRALVPCPAAGRSCCLQQG